MTLPELCECNEQPEGTMAPDATTTTTATTTTDNGKTSLGEALKTLLEQAASQGRVTCSLTSCVELLAQRPDDVMLCVMPTLTQPDAAATIQSTLIRAVCQEHCIRVLSVDCDVKLAKAVCTAPGDSDVEVGGAAGVREEKAEVNRKKRRMVVRKPSVCSDDAMLITGCDNMAPVMGFPCVLVQYPEDQASTEEELVAEFCKEQMYSDTQMEAYLELPD